MLIITFFIISTCQATIKFDSNYLFEWNQDVVPTFLCWNGLRFDQTISFSDSFAAIPQMFTTHEMLDVNWNENFDTAGFNLGITDITLTNFIIHLHCQYERNYRFKIRWFAIDDQRIQILTFYQLIPPQNTSYYYANVNCEKYFTSLTSFSAIGPIDLQLQVYFTPPNIVTVYIPYIQGKSENLKSVGFHLILGIDEAFAQPQNVYSNQNFDSLVYDPNQPDRVEIYPLSGLVYENNNLLQLEIVQTDNGAGTKYEIRHLGAGYTPNYHQKVRMLKSFTKIFYPIICNFIRFSQKLEYRDLPRPMFSVEFIADSDIYTANGYRTISKSVSNFELIIKCHCMTGKKIISKFLNCLQNCPGNKFRQKFEHSCYGAINLLFIHARFLIQTIAIQEIAISINNEGCQIYQYTYNQYSNTVPIVEINMIDS